MDLQSSEAILRLERAKDLLSPIKWVKQGIWLLLFPDRKNTGNFAVTQGILVHILKLPLWVRRKFGILRIDQEVQSGFPLDLENLEKMRVHLENLEISWNFEKFNKYHGKMTWNLEKLGGY